MKKIFLALFFFSFLVVNAQIDTILPYKNSLRYEMIPALNSTFSVGFEQYTTDVSSIVFIPSVMYKEDNNLAKQGFIFEAQYRYHVVNKATNNGKAVISYYVAPYAAVKYFKIEDNYGYSVWNGSYYDYVYLEYTDEFSAFGAGIIGGSEITFAKKLFLDFYIGGGIRTSDATRNAESIVDPGFKGIAPRAGFNIGVRF